MSKKLNCWEFKNCGREKGGLLAKKLGECPVSTAMKYDGLNNGVGAGRACWMVPESVCAKNRFNNPVKSCFDCSFYKRVVYEQEKETVFQINGLSLQAEKIK